MICIRRVVNPQGVHFKFYYFLDMACALWAVLNAFFCFHFNWTTLLYYTPEKKNILVSHSISFSVEWLRAHDWLNGFKILKALVDCWRNNNFVWISSLMNRMSQRTRPKWTHKTRMSIVAMMFKSLIFIFRTICMVQSRPLI